MAPQAPLSPEDPTPRAQPGERRAAGSPLDDALAACAALAPRLAALQGVTDCIAQRQALLQLPAALHAAALALTRLEASADDVPRPEGSADVLTGLADRAELDAAGTALALQYPGTPLMLLAIDVDHLSQVNDTWSHATGDAVLQAVARVLRAQSRPQDVLARADANLFVMALGGPVSTTRALLVAERLRAAIEGHAWMAVGSGLRVTASIGGAARAPGESLDAVLARAGAALQECKRGGRNQVRSRA